MNDFSPPPLPDGQNPDEQTYPDMPPPVPEPGSESDAIGVAGDRHAQRHDSQDTRTYPCDACGGELQFDIKSQQLKCGHCGTMHEIRAAAANAAVNEQDLQAALALVRSGRYQSRANLLDGEKEIVCQNCGGHTTFTGSLTANKCPYCLTPIQRDDVHAAPDRLPVDGVVPFAVDTNQAAGLIKDWIGSLWFAPNEFKKYHRTGEFTSLYAAYFTYDARTDTRYVGERGDYYTVTVSSGDDRHTEVRTRWSRASGRVSNQFDDVTVMANSGFDTDRVAKLNPWPTQTAKQYSAQYVAGHLCRTYDRDVEQSLPEATAYMSSVIQADVRRDIGGDKQRIHDLQTSWTEMSYKHLLMPIWLLTVMYMGKPFQVYINGVTGEVHGARPFSKAKIAAAVAGALLILLIVMVASKLG